VHGSLLLRRGVQKITSQLQNDVARFEETLQLRQPRDAVQKKAGTGRYKIREFEHVLT
jgi:hypothetical protein